MTQAVLTATPKRLSPTKDTLRELFLKSGNLCAFPGCRQLMMDTEGRFIGQICHIEAAAEGGERFNALMTDEQRRAFANLMLLCYPHHITTDDTAAFPVEKLRSMKADHEGRFSDPARAMLAEMKDWTEVDEPSLPANLEGLNRALDWGLTAAELNEPLGELTAYVPKFRNTPVEVRKFLGEVAKRAHKMQGQTAAKIRNGHVYLAVDDAMAALRLEDTVVARLIKALDNYGLGWLDEIDTNDFGPQHAVRIHAIGEGWGWDEIVSVCEAEHISLTVFIEEMQFDHLAA
jgi:hypothetical protein